MWEVDVVLTSDELRAGAARGIANEWGVIRIFGVPNFRPTPKKSLVGSQPAWQCYLFATFGSFVWLARMLVCHSLPKNNTTLGNLRNINRINHHHRPFQWTEIINHQSSNIIIIIIKIKKMRLNKYSPGQTLHFFVAKINKLGNLTRCAESLVLERHMALQAPVVPVRPGESDVIRWYSHWIW